MDQVAARVLRGLGRLDGYPEDLIVVELDSDAYHAVFDQRRIALLGILWRDRKPWPVTELARVSGRAVHAIRDDLQILEDAYLVEMHYVGGADIVRAPQKTIWVV